MLSAFIIPLSIGINLFSDAIHIIPYRTPFFKVFIGSIVKNIASDMLYPRQKRRACLDESEDRVDAVIAVPSDRKVKTNFDRDVVLDLLTRELEFEHELFPINIIFDSNRRS